MRKYSTVISMLLFILIVYWFFIKPKFDSQKIELTGEVVSIGPESKRSGTNLVEVKEKTTTKYVHYSFVNGVIDIQIGDSLLKKPNSNLFVKSKVDGITRLAKDQSPLIRD